jgi:hypothetical protein
MEIQLVSEDVLTIMRCLNRGTVAHPRFPTLWLLKHAYAAVGNYDRFGTCGFGGTSQTWDIWSCLSLLLRR